MHKFDIFCIQEVFTGLTTYKPKLVKYSMEAGLLYSAIPEEPNVHERFAIDSGLVIMS